MQAQDAQVLLEKRAIPDDLLEFFEPADCGACYLCHLVGIFRELRRVLRKDGTVWCNLGDGYASTGEERRHGGFAASGTSPQAGVLLGGRTAVGSLKPKDLVMMPARVALALQADGWWLRSDIIWSKPNPMPESVQDRPTTAHEHVFLLTKAATYYYDAEAIREDGPSYTRKAGGYHGRDGNNASRFGGAGGFGDSDVTTTGRNKRTVWEIATEPLSGVVVHGSHRTVSPDCPVHGYPVSLADAVPDDARQGASQSGRNPRTDGRLAQAPQASAPSTLAGQGGSPSDASAARDHSKQTSRTDSLSGQGDSFDGGESSHTEYTESPQHSRTVANDNDESKTEAGSASDETELGPEGQTLHRSARKQKSEWTYDDPPSNCSCQYTGKVAKKIDHFAGFPQALVEPCVLAGTSERGVCAECGAPWSRTKEPTPEYAKKLEQTSEAWYTRRGHDGYDNKMSVSAEYVTTGWRPTCSCDADTVPATVCDLFAGSGTVGVVAQKLGRRAVLIDASADYLALARKRIEAVPLPMQLGATT